MSIVGYVFKGLGKNSMQESMNIQDQRYKLS